MMDELLVLSRVTDFSVLFLRKQEAFYEDKIELIEKQGAKVFFLERPLKLSFRKVIFCISFILRNLNCFLNLHSFVYGTKSIIYFLRTDIDVLSGPKLSMHCQFATQASILGLMIKKYLKSDADFSLTFHAYDIFVKNRWFNRLASEAKYLFSISRHNIEYVLKQYSVGDTTKLVYSPLGVYIPNLEGKQFSTDKLQIGFMSYFFAMKGLSYLLPAIKLLTERNLNFMFHLAGDGPMKEEVLDYIKQNRLSNNIVYHGLIKNEAKQDFYNKIDLFILPSISRGMETDGLPVVLMEAISYGVPIISTNVSGIPEICIDGFNGYLIEQKDTNAIVEAIVKFSTNRKQWDIFSKNAIETSCNYDIEKNTITKFKLLEW